MIKIIFILFFSFFLVSCTANPSISREITKKKEEQPLLETIIPKELVVVTTDFREYGTEEIIREFEVNNADVNIRHIKYTTEELPNVYEQMKVGFMSGNAFSIVGDVFSLYNENLSYANRGYLADIYELMNNDPNFKNEEYYASIFEALEHKGKLYYFPISFTYFSVVLNKNLSEQELGLFNALDSISYPEMFSFYINVDSNQSLYIDSSYTPADWGAPIRSDIQNELAKFVNYYDQTCSFDSEDFIDLLELYKTIESLKISPDISRSDFFLGVSYFESDLRLSKQYVFRRIIQCFYQYKLQYESNNFTHPIPLTNSSGEIRITPLNYSIYAGSENKDLAWKFLKFATANERGYHAYDISPNKILDRTHLLTLLQEYVMYSKKTTSDVITSLSNRAAALSDYQDELFETMPIANLAVTYDQPLLAIVQEEVELFFLGIQTAEQTAAKIQNKVTLYLLE